MRAFAYTTDELTTALGATLEQLGLGAFRADACMAPGGQEVELNLRLSLPVKGNLGPKSMFDVFGPIYDAVQNSDAVKIVTGPLVAEIAELKNERNGLLKLKHHFETEFRLRHGKAP